MRTSTRTIATLTVIVTVITIAITVGAAKARPALDPAQYTRQTLTHGGVERAYYVHMPKGHTPTRPLPVLILLHGGGGSATQALTSYPLLPLSDREGFVLVAPNGTGPLPAEKMLTFNSGFGFGWAYNHHVDDTGFIRALITELAKTQSIDRRRVYLTGMSNGAVLCHYAAGANADLIAGIAPVVGSAGGSVSDRTPLTWPARPARPLDVIMFNGALDQHIPLEGGWQKKHAERAPRFIASAQQTANFWIEANGCNPTPKVEEMPAQQATRYTWSGGREGTRVVLYVLHNQGHAWPGGKGARIVADTPSPLLDTGQVMWDFFKSRTL
ncbi:MAG: hypothetical protein EB084_16920 [Proteobacteria bacterium]|nr:hypothetical protein [Pseudomonadota bacterium]